MVRPGKHWELAVKTAWCYKGVHANQNYRGVTTWSGTPFCTHLCNYNPGTNQIPPPYWTWIIADRALISPCNGTLSITSCHIPSLMGVCSNRMKKSRSHWHLGPLRCWLREECAALISLTWGKLKANLPYEKQLWRRWLELLCWGKGPPLIVCLSAQDFAQCTGGGIYHASKTVHMLCNDLASRSKKSRQVL